MKGLEPLRGNEKIKGNGAVVGKISDFWKWSYSSLISPSVRGDLAEYLVYLALNGQNVSNLHYQTRMNWDVVDLTYGRGINPSPNNVFCPSTCYGWGIEVKSSSKSNKSGVRFDVSPKNGFHVGSNKTVKYRRNWADIHVFALLTNEDSPVACLDLRHWDFYVVPTARIECYRQKNNKKYKSISLSGVDAAGAKKCDFSMLRETVDSIVKSDYKLLETWKMEHDQCKRNYFEN